MPLPMLFLSGTAAIVGQAVPHSALPSMGRRRIEIKRIRDQRARRATFGKRKAGLFKKAWEFGVLTGSKVHLIIEDERRSKHSFTTDKEDMHVSYQSILPANRVGPEDFASPLHSPTGASPPAKVSTALVLPQTKSAEGQNCTDLFAPDELTMDIVKDCIEVANSLGGPSLLTDCFASDTMKEYMQGFGSLSGQEYLSAPGEYVGVPESIQDVSFTLPSICSPYLFDMGCLPQGGGFLLQDNTNGDNLLPLSQLSTPIMTDNWLMQ